MMAGVMMQRVLGLMLSVIAAIVIATAIHTAIAQAQPINGCPSCKGEVCSCPHSSANLGRVHAPPQRRGIGKSLYKTDIAQGGVISTITSIINQIIQATVYFPAETFQKAVEKATKNIFSAQLDLIRGPMAEVVQIYVFSGAAVFGSAAVPPEVKRIGQRLTEAAVPIWLLSLALIGLGVLTRNAAGMGYGTGELAYEFVRWLLVALASGNGVALISAAHTGFAALAGAIVGLGSVITPSEMVGAFLPVIRGDVLPIVVLVITVLIGVITIIVLAVTYIARYTLLLGITGLAPIAIAFEAIPFTRFFFRDWLSMFLRLEFLQIVNVSMLVIFAHLGFAAAGSSTVTRMILSLVVMLGLSSALIGINTSVFKQVFGTAMSAVGEMRAAGGQLLRVVATVAGVAMTAGASAPVAATAAAGLSAGAAGNTNTQPVAGNASSEAQADFAHSLGATARAIGNATGSAIGRGFGDGAMAGWQMASRRAAVARMQQQQADAEQRRAEQVARETGATHPEDIRTIAESMTKPTTGMSGEQMRNALISNASALRRMRDDQSATTRNPAEASARAAQIAGYDSFGQLAVAMAKEHINKGRDVPTNHQQLTANNQPPNYGPIQQWLNTPLDYTDPASAGMTNFDIGMGVLLSRTVGAEAGAQGLWVQTAHDLRTAYPDGEAYLNQLLQRVRTEQMNERELMAMIEQKVASDPPLRPDALQLPWQRTINPVDKYDHTQ